jgi:hypothetical protein
MRSAHTLNVIRRVVDDVSPIKSRLLDHYNTLLANGAVREAKSLDTIIARLEEWQAKAKG